MKQSKRGVSLVEVMVAIVVLALGVVPLYAVNSGSHEDTTDAIAFLGLLDRLDETLASGSVEGPAAARAATVRDGARALTQLTRTDDAYASFAPRTPVAPATVLP